MAQENREGRESINPYDPKDGASSYKELEQEQDEEIDVLLNRIMEQDARIIDLETLL